MLGEIVVLRRAREGGERGSKGLGDKEREDGVNGVCLGIEYCSGVLGSFG